MGWPGATSFGSDLMGVGMMSPWPSRSRVVTVTVWPVFTSRLPFSNLPRRIFGPWMSWRMATGTPTFFAARRMRFTRRRCWSCVPCEKLSRATFMPARMSSSMISAESEDGPSVQMIFALRMDPHPRRLASP